MCIYLSIFLFIYLFYLPIYSHPSLSSLIHPVYKYFFYTTRFILRNFQNLGFPLGFYTKDFCTGKIRQDFVWSINFYLDCYFFSFSVKPNSQLISFQIYKSDLSIYLSVYVYLFLSIHLFISVYLSVLICIGMRSREIFCSQIFAGCKM